jgi:WD40 repeat protein
MKKLSLIVLIIFQFAGLHAQHYLNHQLRLEPVWARVADALGEPGSVESAEFSPDGKYIVSGTKYDNSVVMWRTSDGAELWRKYTKEEVERVGWSANNKYVAAASEDFLVTVYDANTGEIFKLLQHGRGIDGLTWSHKGSLLVSGEEITENPDGSTDGWVRVFEMPSGREVAKMNHGRTVNELFFSEDNQYLLAVGHGYIKIFDTSDWSLVQTLNPGVYVTFTSGVFSPDGQHVIAVGQVQDGARGNVYLWDWKENKLLKKFNHTGKKIESISWHPNGAYIAHAGHDPYIYVYRVSDILEFSHDNIPIAHKVWASDNAEYIDFNKDGSFLVSAHQNGLIKR